MGSEHQGNKALQLPAEELPLTLDDVLADPALDGVEWRLHSAKYIKERNPRLYSAIVLARKYEIPVEVIAKDLNVSENTVRAVEFQNLTVVEESKKSILNNLRKFVHGATLIMAENADRMDINKLPIAMGIAAEKMLLLEGQATARVEHVAGPRVDDLANEIRDLQATAVQVMDVPGESVREGEGALQKGLENGPALIQSGDKVEETIVAELLDSDDVGSV